MCDFEETDRAEFEMEERLDKEDSSQLATSVESDEWAEGDSQTGEVEALESTMDDSQEWTDEPGTEERVEDGEDTWAEDQAGDSAQENLEENGIYEALANEREETLQDQESIEHNETEDGTDNAEDGTKDAGDVTVDAGHGTEDAEDGTEDAGDGIEDAGNGTVNAGDGNKDMGDGTEDAGDETEDAADGTENTEDGTEGLADGIEDAESPYESENPTNSLGDEVKDSGEATAGVLEGAEAVDGLEDAADGTEEAVDATENAEDGIENAEDGTDAGEVEWLMDESMSEDEDDGSQLQMETEATAEDSRPANKPSPVFKPESLEEDDNNSTEDLLRLLGDGEKTESVIKTSDEKSEVTKSPSLKTELNPGNTDHDADKVKEKRSFNLSFMSNSKPNLTENTARPKRICNGRKSIEQSTPKESTARPATAKQSTARHSTDTQSTAKQRITRQSIAKQSTVKELITKQSNAKQSTAKQSTAKPSTAKQSTPKQSIAKQSTANQSTPKQSIAKQSIAKQSAKPTEKTVKLLSKPVNLTGKWDTVGRIGSTVIKTTQRTVKEDLSKSVTSTHSTVVNAVDKTESAKRSRDDDNQMFRSKRQKTSIPIDKSLMNRSNRELSDHDYNTDTDDQNDSDHTMSMNSRTELDDDSLDSSLGETDAELEELLRGAKTWKRKDGDEGRGNDTSAEEDTDDLLDSVTSSEDDEEPTRYDFTLDVRGERASEFLPLLGRDAAPLLTLQKSSLVRMLESLAGERAEVRSRMRESASQLKELRSQLARLDRQLQV